MRCHVVLPYAWEECVNFLSCVKAVHTEEDVNVLNSFPQEWMESVHGFVMDTFDYHEDEGGAMLTCVDSGGVRHNEHGPAVEFEDGTRFWYQHGELHRDDGPAREWSDGSGDWYKNGIKRNEDGSLVVKR